MWYCVVDCGDCGWCVRTTGVICGELYVVCVGVSVIFWNKNFIFCRRLCEASKILSNEIKH